MNKVQKCDFFLLFLLSETKSNMKQMSYVFKLGKKPSRTWADPGVGQKGSWPTIFLRNFVLLFFKNSE